MTARDTSIYRPSATMRLRPSSKKLWQDVLWCTYRDLTKDRLLAVAGGVVFFCLLALFPALAAFISLYGLFASPASINEHLTLVTGVMPTDALDVIETQAGRLAARGGFELGFGFLLGLTFALWSANSGMKAIIDALNVAYHEEERRSFIRLQLISLALTLGAIAAVLIAISAIVVLPIVLSFIGITGTGYGWLAWLRWPLICVMAVIGFGVLYRFGPSRKQPRWELLRAGTIIAAIVWLIGSVLLSWYMANFADYDAMYGSLGAVIGLMMWMWASSIVLLLGAKVNSEIAHRTSSR